MKIKTQQDAVLAEFLMGNALTPLTAFRSCGTMRLGAVVFNLHDKGFRFTRRRIIFKTKYGTTGNCMCYSIDKKATDKNLIKKYRKSLDL